MILKERERWLDSWRCTCKNGEVKVVWKAKEEMIPTSENFSKYYPCSRCGKVYERFEIIEMTKKESIMKEKSYD
jgi:uncharacterized protein with PIN domain